MKNVRGVIIKLAFGLTLVFLVLAGISAASSTDNAFSLNKNNLELPYPIEEVSAKEDVSTTNEEEQTITVTLTLKKSIDTRPLALLLAPGGTAAPEFHLSQKDDLHWEGSFNFPKDDAGIYQKVFLEVEMPDNTLVQAEVSITEIIKPDEYEPDDSLREAKRIFINELQNRSFHSSTDVDWAYFYGFAKDGMYKIEAKNTSGYAPFVRFCLWDPNGNPVLSSSGRPVCSSSTDNSISWLCMHDGYYYLKIEQTSPSNDEQFYYTLSIQRQTASSPGGVLGRIVNAQGEGVNGVRVYLVSSSGIPTDQPKMSGSIKDVVGNVLSAAMSDGWFFFSQYPSGTCRIKTTEKDDPNKILNNASINKYIYPSTLNYVGEITIPDVRYSTNSVVSDFESVYNHPDLKEYRLLQDDKDNDGLSGLEEFLYKTDPSAYTFKCLLHEGLNLFPYSSPYLSGILAAYNFCSDTLEFRKGDSFWRFNHSLDNPAWTEEYNIKPGENKGGIESQLVNGQGYLVYYKNLAEAMPKVILLDKKSPEFNLKPGLNLMSIPVPQGEEGYTSYRFLKDNSKNQQSGSGGIQSISRYNPSNRAWESSSLVFGQATGVDFPIQPYESYLVMDKRGGK